MKIEKDKCKHNFKYIGGGCCIGKIDGKACDDEFECSKCGERITILCSAKVHFRDKKLKVIC